MLRPRGERSFHELQQVRTFLKLLGVGAEFIKDALRQLTAGVRHRCRTCRSPKKR